MISPARVVKSIRRRVQNIPQNRRIRQSVTPIIVYQMGKVGSMTVTASLAATDIKDLIFHDHFLSDDSIQRLRESIENDHNVRRSEELLAKINQRRAIINADNGKRWKNVTLVREPISRGIGTFMASYFKVNSIFGLSDPGSEGRLSEMRHLYHQRGHKYNNYEAHWFRTELESLFGVDVLSGEFDPSRGYQLYSGEKADVLLVRLEDLVVSPRNFVT